MKIPTDLYFSEKGFLFDPSAGFTYSLNKTGAVVFQRLQEGLGTPEVIEALQNRFNVEPKTAQDDVRDFLQQLKDFGLGTDRLPEPCQTTSL